MSRLKVQETKVVREFVNTYWPDRAGYLKTTYFLVWVLTSKGWFYLNTKFLNEHHAARMQAKVHSKGKIDTTHWSTIL